MVVIRIEDKGPISRIGRMWKEYRVTHPAPDNFYTWFRKEFGFPVTALCLGDRGNNGPVTHWEFHIPDEQQAVEFKLTWL